jgi:LysM repeat protein
LGGASALVPPATTAPATRTAPIAATTRSQASASVLDGSGAVAGAKTKLDAGDVLAARHLLTAALQSSQLADADATGIKQQVSQINETVLFSSRRFADDEFGGTYTVKPGDRLTSIAAQYQVTWDLLASLNGISDPKRMKAGQTLKVIRGPFHALVHKRRFTLELYLGAPPGETGSVFVTSFPVGLGKDDSTPTGTWMVQPSGKLRKPKFWGAPGLPPREGDDPENPLGPFWIGLSGTDGHAVGKIGYGIHGTSEPDSIGKQSSLGCIRMHNEDVARVFQLLVESKSIVVVED